MSCLRGAARTAVAAVISAMLLMSPYEGYALFRFCQATAADVITPRLLLDVCYRRHLRYYCHMPPR